MEEQILETDSIESLPIPDPIAVISDSSVVTLSDSQFMQLTQQHDTTYALLTDLNNNLFWIACILVCILGVQLIKSFWDGWRATK